MVAWVHQSSHLHSSVFPHNACLAKMAAYYSSRSRSPPFENDLDRADSFGWTQPTNNTLPQEIIHGGRDTLGQDDCRNESFDDRSIGDTESVASSQAFPSQFDDSDNFVTQAQHECSDHYIPKGPGFGANRVGTNPVGRNHSIPRGVLICILSDDRRSWFFQQRSTALPSFSS